MENRNSKAIRINGQLTTGLIIMRFITRAALFFLVYLAIVNINAQDDDSWLAVLGICGGSWILLELYWWGTWMRSQWIKDNGDGFTVSSLFSSHDYLDSDVTATSFTSRDIIHGAGIIGGDAYVTKIEYYIWLADGRKITAHWIVLPDKENPLGDFINRLEDLQTENAQAALADGRVVTGDGSWILGPNSIRIAKGTDGFGGETEMPEYAFEDLYGVGTIDNEILIWHKGSDYPLLKKPLLSQNVALLARLLADRIPESEPDPIETEGLGRFLCQTRKRSLFATSLTIHERGLKKGSRIVRFADVESFKWSKTIQYYNGIYIATSIAITLFPFPESGEKKFKATRDSRKIDEMELGFLRDVLTSIIYDRMLKRFEAEGTFDLGGGMILWKDRIEYNAKKMLGGVKSTVIPFSDVREYGFRNDIVGLQINSIDGKTGICYGGDNHNYFPGAGLIAHAISDWQDKSGIADRESETENEEFENI